MDQAFPLRFCILQAIKNWMVERPGNEDRQHSNLLVYTKQVGVTNDMYKPLVL